MNDFLKNPTPEVEPPVGSLNGPAGPGLDLKPQVPRVARVSWRVYGTVTAAAVLLACGLYYGLKHRGEVAHAASINTKPISPATEAGKEIAGNIKPNPAALPNLDVAGIGTPTSTAPDVVCGSDPITGQPDQFQRTTGMKCTQWIPNLSMPARLPPVSATPHVRREAPVQTAAIVPPDEQSANDREQQAILAPTSTRSGTTAAFQAPAGAPSASLAAFTAPDHTEDTLHRIAALQAPQASGLTDKEQFLADAQRHKNDDYLPSVRTPSLSPYEIRAGWIIPAVLEHAINSDLPGETRALVMSNVYDTASGAYLLIPQGSRLVGKYDSRVSYGQGGVQCVWNRIIYPDGSSLDLDGMAGTDAEGQAGMRDQVDRHYKRVVGFAALTSGFAAAAALTQRSQFGAGAFLYPSAQQTASGAAGREITETGMELTRRNLNVQPTIKIRAGERFAVRVNRDILFDAPYTARPARR